MIQTAPALVVLAAGLSSRYNAASNGATRLKQFEAIGPAGTLLDYSVYDAVRAGFARVLFVIRAEFEKQFREGVADRFADAIEVGCVHQRLDDLPPGPWECAGRGRIKPWGTGHATWSARHDIREPFAVINADDFYGRESFEKLAGFLSQPDLESRDCRNCLVGFTLRETLSPHGSVARGVCAVSADGLLEEVIECTGLSLAPDGSVQNLAADGTRTAIEGDVVASLNMWGFSAGIFPRFESALVHFLERAGNRPTAEFYIPTAVDEMIRDGTEQFQVLRSSAGWFGVTYREDAAHVRSSLEKLHAAGEYPHRLWPA